MGSFEFEPVECHSCVQLGRDPVVTSTQMPIHRFEQGWVSWRHPLYSGLRVCNVCWKEQGFEGLVKIFGEPVSIDTMTWQEVPEHYTRRCYREGSVWRLEEPHYTRLKRELLAKNPSLQWAYTGAFTPHDTILPDHHFCASCRMGGSPTPSRWNTGRLNDALREGWVRWGHPKQEELGVCPDCWRERSFAELTQLLDYPVALVSYDPSTMPEEFVGQSEHWRNSWTLRPEARTRVEEAFTKAEAAGKTANYGAMPTPDAPLPRIRPTTIPLDATPEMIVRDHLNAEVLGQLGRGGLGTVLKVRDDQGIVQAFKYIHAATHEHAAFERLRREILAMQQLAHPNVVAVTKSFLDRRIPAFYMELVDGLPLRKVLRLGPVSPLRAFDIIEQVCAGLSHAHQRGIVHRDIKPENVLLDRDNTVKITDFGIAKLAADMPDVFTLTGTGDTLGTPVYMAPEQKGRPKDADHRVDVFATGVMLYEMLSGGRPERGPDGAPVLKSLDARFDRLLKMATAADPDHRYPTIDAFAEEALAVRLGLESQP